MNEISARLTVGAWIAIWVSLSVSIIMVNKHVLSYTAFHFPFFLAVCHMVFASVTSRAGLLALQVPDSIRQHSSSKLNLQLASIGVLFGSALVAGNAALRHLTVPTVQMLKAGGPATIYILGICLGSESLQPLQTLKVLVVCTGVGIASYGDVTLNLVGMVLQIASIIMDALRCCFLQKVLQQNQVDATALVTLAHIAPYAAAALVVPMAIVEGPAIIQQLSKWQSAIPMVVLSGLLAACLNFVVFKLIQLTSALTTSLSGVIKEWVCILVAMQVYSTTVTNLQWVGYSIAIVGLLWYQSGRLAASATQSKDGSPRNKSSSVAGEQKVRLLGSGGGSQETLRDMESGGKCSC